LEHPISIDPTMPDEPTYHFVLLRHGQSQWNQENRFTGWTDIALTAQGRQETRQAAQALKEAGVSFDYACTSILKRAVESLAILVDEMHLQSLPIEHTWRLNERHYGCLQGLNKTETANRLGRALVSYWRRSYTGRPPALEFDDHRHPRFDPLFSAVPRASLPATESLKDTELRGARYWNTTIRPLLQGGLRVLILAHGNSLRALVRYLEQIPPVQAPELDVPTAVPLIYRANADFTRYQRVALDRLGSDPHT